METMFSNFKIRMLNSVNKNPDLLKHVTLLVDGHDNRINYEDISLIKSKLYSYKFKRSGFRTQIYIDSNDMILYVSDSLPCKDNVDGNTIYL